MRFQFLWAVIAIPMAAQQLVTTYAGTDWTFPRNGVPLSNAPLSREVSLASDPQGRLLIADFLNHLVFRVDSSGILTVVAGNGLAGFSGDGGPATSASLSSPAAVRTDSAGNLYIADKGNGRIRKVATDGTISTIGGNGTFDTTGDNGPALRAGMTPTDLAVDSAGVVTFADNSDNRIRRIGLNGIVSALGGNGDDTFNGEGKQARNTAFVPTAIALDRDGSLLVSDSTNYRIYRIATSGILTVIAGTGKSGDSGDNAPARSAAISNVEALTVDTGGNIYLCDTSNARLRRISSSGTITTVAGTGSTNRGGSSGAPLQTPIGNPGAVAIDTQGRVYVADIFYVAIWRIASGFGAMEVIGGNAKFKEIAADSPALLATFSGPQFLAFAPDGTAFVSDTDSNRIYKISPDGKVNRYAGQGVYGCCEDGPALDAIFGSPSGIALDRQGNLLVADTDNNLIRKITPDGIVSTIVGTGDADFYGDNGPAIKAAISVPIGIVVDPAGNLLIADWGNDRVRRVSPNGVITTVAGNGRTGYSGDNGPATAAALNGPSGLAFNRAGELLIADADDNRIRAVSAAGVIRTIAGNGSKTPSGDGGPATAAGVLGPTGLAVDSNGNIFLTQAGNPAIRVIDPSGIIRPYAGQAAPGFSGDGGPAVSAQFKEPTGLLVDASGSLFVADSGNNRIRVIRTLAPSITLSPTSLSLTTVTGGASSESGRLNVSSNVAGLPFQVNVAYGQSSNWLTLSATSGNAPASLTVSASAANLAAGRYTATLTITSDPPGTANPVSVVLDVADAAPRLRLSSDSISFSGNEGSAAQVAALEVRNDGGGTLTYQVSATNAAGLSWLSAAPATGSLRAGAVGTVSVVADPRALKAGTFLGSVTVTVGATRIAVPVTLNVRGARKTFLISQSGLTFTTVANGGSPTVQKVGILNIGSGVLNWQATRKASWLRLPTPNGTVQQPWLDVSNLDIQIVNSGLAAGEYYDQIQITGDAENSPQVVTIKLVVLPEGSNPGPEVSPSGMVFVSREGENPGSQSITLNHLGKGSATYDSSRLGGWYSTAPGNGRVDPNAPGAIVVQPGLAAMPSGVRRGVVTFQVQEDGSIRTVNLLSVVAPADAVKNAAGRRYAASCASPNLRVESTSLRDGFNVTVGEAVTVEVKAADECGNLLIPGSGGTGAQVAARPENGDPQFPMAHIGNGVWRGTWRPVRAAANTRVTVVAIFAGTAADLIAGRTQAGNIQLNGVVQAAGAKSAPILTAGGVVHAASFESGIPIAPGSLISLYGARMSDTTGLAPGLPLPATLNGTEVRLGDRPLPLLFTSDGQLNAQVPYDVPMDTQHQITVKRGDSIAVPETLTVSAAQPGIFSKSQTGSGQGAIVKQDGVTLAQPGTPARKGEVIIIYCSGLGPVSPAVVSGQPAPSSPLASTVNPVTVSVGGVDAQVLFAGLSPGFSGLYQVNAFVPASAPTGDAVEVTVQAAGQRSKPVTIAVQ